VARVHGSCARRGRSRPLFEKTLDSEERELNAGTSEDWPENATEILDEHGLHRRLITLNWNGFGPVSYSTFSAAAAASSGLTVAGSAVVAVAVSAAAAGLERRLRDHTHRLLQGGLLRRPTSPHRLRVDGREQLGVMDAALGAGNNSAYARLTVS